MPAPNPELLGQQELLETSSMKKRRPPSQQMSAWVEVHLNENPTVMNQTLPLMHWLTEE